MRHTCLCMCEIETLACRAVANSSGTPYLACDAIGAMCMECNLVKVYQALDIRISAIAQDLVMCTLAYPLPTCISQHLIEYTLKCMYSQHTLYCHQCCVHGSTFAPPAMLEHACEGEAWGRMEVDQ